MKLDTLEIHGFKSFADRTVLKFNPGVTAIVGPNGCGKTNITDAIRWVLGEQRPTTLRGSSMQEVIFNGSRERKPIGMAEITLTFSNALGLIPLDYSEVSVTRRVFRDGEGQYLLNRSVCNLKDIRDLFMGTGVGAAAYSLIEQKMIDAILSDRAEERRLLFEEAAGVTKYKARRKATERKLEATEEDLRRLSDILTEVRKNANSLRRQMGKARRFEALQRAELRLAVALARTELADLEAREGPLRATIASLEGERAQGSAAALAHEAELARLDVALSERRAEERGRRERVEAAAAELEGFERERMLAREGRRHAALEVERLTREVGEHRAQSGTLVEKREGLAGALDEGAGEAEAARLASEAREASVRIRSEALEAAQAVLREAREARERCADERLRVQAELARAAAELQAATDRRTELEGALAAHRASGVAGGAVDRASAEIGEADGRTIPDWLASPAGGSSLFEGRGEPVSPGEVAGEEQELVERVEQLGAWVRAAEAELRDASLARLTAEGDVTALEAELAELEARRREVTARLDTLEELRDGFVGFGEGARRALEARDAIAPGLRGPLGLELEVAEPRYAAAVEAYLDAFLDALLTPETGEARAVLDFWRERNQTGAVWPLADVAPAGHPTIDPAAAELVLCRGPEAAGLRGELDRYREALFGRLLLAEDLDRATELRKRLNRNGCAGWFVVAALSGEILEPSGMVRLPQRKTEGDGDGVARFHQAEHLKAVLGDIASEARTLEARVRSAQSLAEATGGEERSAGARLVERSGELDRAERELERLRDARRAALARAAELARELAGVSERHARESRLAEEAAVQSAAVRARLETADAEWHRREAEVEARRVEREAALRELGAAELAAEQKIAAQAALERERRYLEEAAAEQERLAVAKEGELGSQRARIASLEAEAARLADAALESRARLEALREDHRVLDQAIRALEEERMAREALARAARQAHDEASQRLHLEEMRLADMLHRRQSIHTVLETEFGRPLPELIRLAEDPVARGRELEGEDRLAEDPVARGRELEGEDRLAESPAARGRELEGEDRLAESPVARGRELEGEDRLTESPAARGRELEGEDRLAEDPVAETPEERAAAIEALREELRRVRERKSALGPVNLLALQEFGAEKERLDFLDAQVADLVKAREDLRLAIRKINATARELFVETFVRARENFQTTFATLFEGGRADISLVDEADPLESPIEIEASPRGKRIQAVNLLSGGERALTALSLLFAIYLVKPSPFCILDEVDAPLDDANIGRFLRMIRRFSDTTQFIIVTHNKRTMEASDFLYGVTMEEPGVSTLVSVDFERRHSFDYEAIAYRGRRDEPVPGDSAAEPVLDHDGSELLDEEQAPVGD